ncbi:MAG: hypothetical protein RL634_238 [Bacteroidota bacterium]
MARISIKQAIKRTGRRLKGKIHIEDWIDIQEIRTRFFQESEKLIKELNEKPNTLFKELARLSILYKQNIENRWNSDVLKAFCNAENIYNVLQKDKYV